MENGALQKLFDILETLRGDNGCPWDQAQTAENILSDLVEEAYELQWAYANESSDDLMEELGDVVFVLVFAIALIREEHPSLSLETLTARTYQKIKRRHPHVFEDAVARTKEEGLAHWDRIKAEERKEKTASRQTLADVPGGLPPLRRSEKLQRLAAAKGFDWRDVGGILAKIREEVDELEAVLGGDGAAVEDEVGDLFFSVVNLSRFLNIDGDKALTTSNAKFVRRFHQMERLAKADGHVFDTLSLDEMDGYWERAKQRE